MALGSPPAYAGKRARPKTPPLTPLDHPRMCGEKYKIKKRYPLEMGSPPHVRGKVIKNHMEVLMQRITPAYAGKSDRADIILSPNRDHPRVCGEKFCFVLSLYNLLGSPPRMRGKGRRHLGPQLLHGITPAYAGKSRLCYVLGCFCKDHPRVCGEKKVMRGAKDKRMGSPPHVRGKGFALCNALRCRGITPACAGKSWSNALPCSRREDHPRVCGEKFFAAYGAMPLSGSPPRMRGKD